MLEQNYNKNAVVTSVASLIIPHLFCVNFFSKLIMILGGKNFSCDN